MFNLTPWRKQEKNGEQALTRVEDEFPLGQFRREFDAIFDRFFHGWPTPFMAEWPGDRFWGLDLDDAGNEVVVRAEAPGFEAKDFDIQVSGNLLTIRAQQKSEPDGKSKNGYQYERQFQRSVTLPAGVDVDKVDARYRNGILELHLPKLPQALGRRIEVKT